MVGRAALLHEVPSGWTRGHLGEMGKWLSGGTPRMSNPDFWGGEIPWISPKDMKRSRLSDAIDHVTEKALGNGTRLTPPRSLLLVVRGMILAHTFPVAQAEVALAFNQDIKALIPRSHVDSDFLLWWLTANESLLLSITTESTHGTKRVPMDGLHGVVIDLPQPAEQRAIATALSDVDALLEGLARLIAKKRDLKQAAMQQLLTGQTRLPGFHGEWAVKTLGRLATFRTGPFGSALHKSDYTDDGVPLVNPMHIIDGQIVPTRTMTVTEDAARKLSDVRLRPGDIVMGRRGDMGRCAVVRCEHMGWLCGTGSIIVRPCAEVDAGFLQRVLSSPTVVSAIEDSSVGSTMVNLNQGTLSGLVIQAPPIQEQTAIAAVLSDMDAELAALEARRDKTRALKQAMMQELLTGRTRLV